MRQRKNLSKALGIAALALMFGAPSIYAQTGSAQGSAGTAEESRAGMSGASGSTDMPAASGSSGSSGATSSGASASGSSDSGAQSTSGASESSSASKSASGKSVSKADRNIMREMAQANMVEVQAASIALKQSNSDEVKTFAQKMIDDHTQAQKELEQLAEAKGVTLPTAPDRKHQAMMKKLGALEGEKFDKEYMKQGGLKDHNETHKMLNRAQARANDPELKALAAKMEPVVGEHMKMAQDIHGDKGTASGSSGSSKEPAGASGSSGSSGSSDSSPGATGGTGSSGSSGSSGSPGSTSGSDSSGK